MGKSVILALNAAQLCNASFFGSVSRTGRDPVHRNLNYLLLRLGWSNECHIAGAIVKTVVLLLTLCMSSGQRKESLQAVNLVSFMNTNFTHKKKIKRGKVISLAQQNDTSCTEQWQTNTSVEVALFSKQLKRYCQSTELNISNLFWQQLQAAKCILKRIPLKMHPYSKTYQCYLIGKQKE